MQLLPRAPRQPQGLHLPVPPVELRAQGRPAGRAVPARRQAGRQGQRRHAGRLQAGRATASPSSRSRRAAASCSRRSIHDVEPLEDFLGPAILRYFDRLFDGRKLKILGYNRQRIPGNWKLMQENIKDPYHPGLLHTWFVTFGLWRADNKSQLLMDERHRHAAMISTRGQTGKAEQVTRGVELQGRHEARGPALPRHRAGAVVGRPDRGDDDGLPERDPAAAGELRVDAPHPARRPRRVRFRLDPLRLRRRHARDDAAPAAPGQPVRPGRLRVGRRRRGHRALAGGLRAEALPPHARRARRPRRRRHRPHGHRDADPRHVPLLARGDGGG